MRVTWASAWRIVASRYPPVDLFERLTADHAVWDALIAAEQLTNPRLRDEIGDIALVPAEDRISGPGASYVMASFTHVNPRGSRFSDGTYGVYYAAATLQTAIAETVFHFEQFAADSADPPRTEDMRVLVGSIDHPFEDVSSLSPARLSAVLAPDTYAAAQAYGRELRDSGAAGVVYPSVRDPAGQCVGAFKPRAVAPPHQERHLKYRWNGERVDRYFDYQQDRWIALERP
jgi:hypothetical protein